METTFYTVSDLAKMFSVKPMTVYRWIREGKITYKRVAGYAVRFTPEDIQGIIDPGE